MMITVFIMIHIIICLVIGVLLYTKRITTRTLLFPTVVCVPVVGLALLLTEQIMQKKELFGSSNLDVDKLKVEEVRFKRIEMERAEQKEIVPLEEALIMNDVTTRRQLMLDILQRNPEEYIELLQRARMADDTELTHYATTAMMEIQSGYEHSIRAYEELLEVQEEKEQRAKVLRKMRKVLMLYIESGLISGNILTIYQRKLGVVLSELIQIEPENKAYYLNFLLNKIEQRDLNGLKNELDIAKKRWPEDEQVYRIMVRYYQMVQDGASIQETLNEIEQKGIYLSADGKQWFDFWKNKEMSNET